jgi:serine/threonine protein phosphatase PrpC
MADAPSLGTLSVSVVSAEYEGDYVDGAPHTYCALWLLEKVKWRRRKSAQRGRGDGEVPLRPRWDETFEFDDVRSDSKLAIDVWNIPADSSTEEFFGKVTIVLSDAMQSAVAASHELLPGRIEIALRWTPQSGSVAAVLSLPPSRSLAQSPMLPVTQPTGGVASLEDAAATGAAPQALTPDERRAAMRKLEAQAQAYEMDEFESEDDDQQPEPVRSAAPPAAAQPVAATPAAILQPAEYFEFTHRGGSGNGPKENQDAHFLERLDEKNAIFGVCDGHGHDHGRIAARAAAAASKAFLREHFARLRNEPHRTMEECFESAHAAVFEAIKAADGVFEDPETPGVLVQEVAEEDWPLGFDAADGGTTVSLGAIVDGRTLVYAAAGDSCALLGVPTRAGTMKAIELIPEHSPTNRADWADRMCKTGVHVVFDHPEMFDDQPASLIPVWTPDGRGGWEIAESTLQRADELGCGLKTERGDRAAVVMTPESGRFSQMMLGVTRSVGDFYHQTFGVTWLPEVVIHDLGEVCSSAGVSADDCCLIIASDGVWDHWEFDDSMEALCDSRATSRLTDRRRVLDFFEETRAKGEDAFGDGADNLTGVVALLPNPGPMHPKVRLPGVSAPSSQLDCERDIGDLGV